MILDDCDFTSMDPTWRFWVSNYCCIACVLSGDIRDGGIVHDYFAISVDMYVASRLVGMSV